MLEVLDDHLSRLESATAQLRAGEQRRVLWYRSSLESLLQRESDGKTRLAELLSAVEAGRSLGGSAGPAAGDEWGIIKVSAMTWGEFREEENKAIPDRLVNPRFEIKPGDLLVSRANTSAYVGAPVLVRKTRPRLLLSDKSLRLKPKPDVDVEWLISALSAPSTRRQITSAATGTKDSMRNISQGNLLRVLLPAASARQQTEVVRRLTETTSCSQQLQQALTATTRRTTVLRRALLEAAFTGCLIAAGRSRDELIEEMAGV